MTARFLLLTALLLSSLAAVPASGHGELDDQHVSEFHLHLDDYREEIEALVADVNALVSDYDSGADMTSAAEQLIEQWEAVAVHEAIEKKAISSYGGIWQALAALQEAVGNRQPTDTITSAAGELEAALWQGYDGLQQAASAVGEQTDDAAD